MIHESGQANVQQIDEFTAAGEAAKAAINKLEEAKAKAKKAEEDLESEIPKVVAERKAFKAALASGKN